MHDIRWIRENAEEMATGLARRGFSPDEARRQVDDLVAKDEARRAHLASLQEMQERRNYLSKEIGNAMRAKDMARAEEL
jgi:seryl-tRNA synthetase